VGDFTHADGSHYVLIVNKSFAASAPAGPQFRTPVTKVEKLSQYTGALGSFEGENT